MAIGPNSTHGSSRKRPAHNIVSKQTSKEDQKILDGIKFAIDKVRTCLSSKKVFEAEGILKGVKDDIERENVVVPRRIQDELDNVSALVSSSNI